MRDTVQKPADLWWWEPAWSFRPQARRELGRVLKPGLLLRVLTISAVVVAGLALGVRRGFPELEFDWLNGFAWSVLAVFGAVALFGAASVFIPPMIVVNHHGLARQAGQTFHYLKPGEVRLMELEQITRDRAVLRVSTARGMRQIGVAPKMDLDLLAARLAGLYSCFRRIETD